MLLVHTINFLLVVMPFSVTNNSTTIAPSCSEKAYKTFPYKTLRFGNFNDHQ